jgi:hypothetical protein
MERLDDEGPPKEHEDWWNRADTAPGLPAVTPLRLRLLFGAG